jgi:hypothetical protein
MLNRDPIDQWQLRPGQRYAPKPTEEQETLGSLLEEAEEDEYIMQEEEVSEK